MKLLLMGAPGSGKGTQAEKLAAHFGIPTISTGGMLRDAIANRTDTGLRAKTFVDSGAYVPDGVMLDLVLERLRKTDCKNGFILDGYPRTLPQAQSLSAAGFTIDAVAVIDISDDKIVERLSGRRVCKGCDAAYHVKYKPSDKGDDCDRCGSPLIIREDDKPETVLRRLEIYHELTAPVVEYYREQLKVVSVDGSLPAEEITQLLIKELR